MMVAAENMEVKGTEIVFLLDTSESMNKQDKERAAIDAVRQMIYCLPSNYRVGLVAYNTGIQSVIPLGMDMDAVDAALEAVQYTGYTNAGEGLSEAVKLFSEETGRERYIIMISDGEIDMPKSEEKEHSRISYVEAAEHARDSGIKILIGAIGTEINNPQMHIFDGAELTDGAIYWEGQLGSVSQIMERIVKERLAFPRQEVGVTDAGGGEIYVKLPENANTAKVLLIGTEDISEVTADYSAESGRTISGKRFAVVTMARPASEAIEIHFKTEDIEGIKAYMLTEYSARTRMDISYRMEELPQTEEEINKKIPLKYEHFADITLKLEDTRGKRENLWMKEEFEGQEITYTLNDMPFTGIIKQGMIQTSISLDGVETIETMVSMENQPAVYYIDKSGVETIEKYPDPAPVKSPDYRPLLIILSLLAVATLMFFILWVKRKSTTVIYMAPSPKEPEKKLETRNCTYSGRFSMYVVRTKDGRDIPPQTYPLFGRANGRLTLDKILTACGIKFGKIGGEDIIFYPGPEHSIIMMDQSEGCTVMRGTEIMKKGMGYPVFYNEKITVTFEDGMTEVEIHYKNLKPSEREKIKGM